jgi:hypothetical protein
VASTAPIAMLCEKVGDGESGRVGQMAWAWPGEHYPFLFIRKNFKLILIDSIKQWLPEFKFFQINHGCEGFEVRNNFSYMNFLILEKNFGLKFKEVSRV